MLILWICFSIESESDESFADSISALGIFNKLNASHIFPSGSRLLLVKKAARFIPILPNACNTWLFFSDCTK